MFFFLSLSLSYFINIFITFIFTTIFIIVEKLNPNINLESIELTQKVSQKNKKKLKNLKKESNKKRENVSCRTKDMHRQLYFLQCLEEM